MLSLWNCLFKVLLSPLQRITVPELLENEWFKKGYRPPYFEEGNEINHADVDAVFDKSEVKPELMFNNSYPP